MMFIVDGTGDGDPQRYDRDMGRGFCRRLEKECRGIYYRGPTTFDLSRRTADIADEVLEDVQIWRRLPLARGRPLFLTGHSRGGAAVIFVAQALKRLKVDVDALFLFDAVDRALTLRRAKVVPSNVRRCWHALRDPSLSSLYSPGVAAARDEVARLLGLPAGRRPLALEDVLDLAIKSPPKSGPLAQAIEKLRQLVAQDAKMKRAMRSVTMNTDDGATTDFGNCGVEHENPKALEAKTFLGSHGAIGGAPLLLEQGAPALLIDSDRAAMADVQAWMWGKLQQQGALKPA